MKKLICEMCGSPDFIKKNGAYICQYCGTKYILDKEERAADDEDDDDDAAVKISFNVHLDL